MTDELLKRANIPSYYREVAHIPACAAQDSMINHQQFINCRSVRKGLLLGC
jgi:hypothetical protein